MEVFIDDATEEYTTGYGYPDEEASSTELRHRRNTTAYYTIDRASMRTIANELNHVLRHVKARVRMAEWNDEKSMLDAFDALANQTISAINVRLVIPKPGYSYFKTPLEGKEHDGCVRGITQSWLWPAHRVLCKVFLEQGL
jgi:hypothetical protein